jgi:class 3 adenylate cyclase/tetratricopeptide (TPR) repeat protein
MRCPACQTEIGADARFCSACGERLDRGTAPGERKVVTVLFADIVGSTELIGDVDPEHALARLPPAIARMGNAVNQLQGTIMRTMGDGLMVIFGVPQAQEDHAMRACQAALIMRQSSKEHDIVLRVGIHSGEIIAGLTDEFTKQQSVYGAAVHLASRLEHMAGPGDICITDATFRLVQPLCEAQSLGRHEVKGFARPIDVYKLNGLKPAGARPFRDALATAYRGRSTELTVLRQAFADAGRGKGQAIGICAPPGIGKSRLCFEFARSERERLVPVLEARASPYDYSGPLQPLIEFFRTYFRIAASDDAAAARTKIASRIEAIVPAMRDDVPMLAEFLGVAGGAAQAPRLDPAARHARLIELVRALVRDGVRSPSIIIIEDVHWLDDASGEFISALVDVAPSSRALIILTYRPTLKAAWKDNPSFQEIQLGELSDDDVSALVKEALGEHPTTQAVASHIVERSGGNPFFAEELIRSLIDSGALVGQHGNYVGPGEWPVETLPATLQSVVGARIDRLQPSDKTLLQIGATIGREFPVSVLQEVAGAAAGDVQNALVRLSDLELVQSLPYDEGPERFAFRHPLIQEVAYAMQLRARRVTLHAAVARAIERFHHNQLNEYADLIAYHFEAAKDPVSAASYTARAAAWIFTTNSRLAIKSWQKVRLLLQSQPPSPAIDRLRMTAAERIVYLGWREGMSSQEAAPLAEEATALARELGDAVAEVIILAGYGRIIAATGSADTYVELVLRALELSTKAPPGVKTLLQACLCQACGHAGKLREALEASNAALMNVARIEPSVEAAVGFNIERWVQSLRSRLLVRAGDFAAARVNIAGLIADEAAHPDPAVQFIPHLAFVELAWLTDDARLAHHHATHIEDIAQRTGVPYVAVYGEACQGVALSLAGNHVAAIQRLQKALSLARQVYAGLGYEPEILTYLAEVHLADGLAAEAVKLAEEAIAVSIKRGARLAECRATIALARALRAEQGGAPHSRANHLMERARQLIEETGARAFQRLLHNGHPAPTS